VTKTAAGLSEPAWNALLNRLGPDTDAAGAEYEVLRRQLSRYIEWRGCSDSEDQADMVLTRLARKLEMGEIVVNLHAYALGIARCVFREHLARRAPAPLDVATLATRPDDQREAEEPDDRHNCLERCLEKLAAESRAIVLRYYEGDGGSKITIRHAMARELGITDLALRLRVFRARETLEECVHRCLAGWRSMSGAKHA
jgi:DNA-directed RNA polymerase specialized sigma24 family protein